ncbi:hypothetical protein K470DRAFT_262635 [Piedraia hortae CBS 480.64]|uniref:Uncharacterized protein n=1 Tax=Piedraia hortae CBS 480.64 TaxID=1314780 RepID=A0A6A7C7Y4_9PEZI|nr:hypothetical protein K470DRAFT_262635 [Piedraia hortae CBS 480.64]
MNAAGCMSSLQPLDMSVNEPIKRLVRNSLDEQQKAYEETHKYCSDDRRIMVEHTMLELQKEHGRDIIRQPFKCTSISVTPTGEEDDKVHIKVVSNYSFANRQQGGNVDHNGEEQALADPRALDSSWMGLEDLRLRLQSYKKDQLKFHICSGSKTNAPTVTALVFPYGM